jgi:hypothetical protein
MELATWAGLTVHRFRHFNTLTCSPQYIIVGDKVLKVITISEDLPFPLQY